MDPRSNFDHAQCIIGSHSNELIDYLNKVIGQSKDGTCRQEKLQGRLFENIINAPLSDELNEFFSDKLLSIFVDTQFSAWIPILNEANITEIKHNIIDHFFIPIEQNKAWKAFLEDQQTKIIDSNELQKIRDYIASAFAFKIISRFAAKKNFGKNDTKKCKFDIFNLVINNFSDEENIKNRQLNKTKNFFISEIGEIFGDIFRGAIKRKEISNTLENQLANIRNNPHYLALTEEQEANEKNIYENLLDELKRFQSLPDLKDKNYVIKKIAEGILQDIKKYHYHNIHSSYIKNAIEKVKPLIGRKSEKACADLLKEYDCLPITNSNNFSHTQLKNRSESTKKLIISLSEEKDKSITNKPKALVRSASTQKEEKRTLSRSMSGHWHQGSFKAKIENKVEQEKKTAAKP